MSKRSQRKAAKPSRSTALVRAQRMIRQTAREMRLATAAPMTAALPTLAPEPMMTASFIGTLKLAEKQIKALRRPVEDGEIEWRPVRRGGPPAIPYLSHNGYRDRLDAAFGLGGWGMVPVGAPKEKDSIIYVPFALVIAGVPRVYAWGEQEYFAENAQMTYGDALEGAKSNAITRCGKELGIARELWTRRYVEALKRRLLLPERSDDRGGSDGRFAGRPAPRRDYQAPPREAPVGSNRSAGEPITDKQRKRLWVILRNSGRDEQIVKAWLERRFGWTSTKQVTRRDYEFICTAIEAPAALPERAS